MFSGNAVQRWKNAVGSAAHHKGKTAGRQKKQQAARRHELRYQKKLTEVVKSFSEDNTTDVKNHYTDRTNTDARLLPCEVFETKTVDNFVVYRLYNPPGIIKICFLDR